MLCYKLSALPVHYRHTAMNRYAVHEVGCLQPFGKGYVSGVRKKLACTTTHRHTANLAICYSHPFNYSTTSNIIVPLSPTTMVPVKTSNTVMFTSSGKVDFVTLDWRGRHSLDRMLGATNRWQVPSPAVHSEATYVRYLPGTFVTCRLQIARTVATWRGN